MTFTDDEKKMIAVFAVCGAVAFFSGLFSSYVVRQNTRDSAAPCACSCIPEPDRRKP